ncbi:MAG TPA: hypothetical protein VFE55_09020 [Acidimicrobiia bacterium]|nr:hypothetical protein [Acidimicrobiia bacterium]
MFGGIPVDVRPGGRAAAWVLRVLVAAGLAAMALSWARASDTVQVSEQVDWASVSLAGVTAVTLGLVASVLIARQAVAVRLARVTAAVATPELPAGGPVALAVAAPVNAPAANGVTSAEGELVAAARMARYHTPTCPLTIGKPVRPASRTDHERAGRQPCGVCAP